MYTQEDFEKSKKAVSKIELLEGQDNELGGYKSPVLICLDAVLSINRKYYNFVVPRIKKFQKNYSNIDTLKKLKELIENSSIEQFSNIWNYNHPQRIEILSTLVDKLILYGDIKHTDDSETELKKLQLWAKTVNVFEYKSFNVPGIGVATYQYIRMLLVAKTVKPDVHIKRYIYSLLDKYLNEYDTIHIFERACNDQNIDVAQADHSLWKQYASFVDKRFVWQNQKWIKKEEEIENNKYS